jgi:MGT family glycosyltransferase
MARREGAVKPAVAFFAMTEVGHFQRLRPLIAGMVERGFDAYVFTDRRFAVEVERAGAAFVDLFAVHSLESADDESVPFPSRFVSFAGRYGEEVAREVEGLGVSLIVYDTFAVLGPVVGRLVGVPYVNVCAGHNMNPARFRADLEVDPRVSISTRCREAVAALRSRYGMDDASPFSYVSAISPFLNVYCEPPAFLLEAERRAFEPIAFFGSLPPLAEIAARRRDGGRSWFEPGAELRAYVSFGTVIWRYWAAEALAALAAIVDAFAALPQVRAVVGLGGAPIAAGHAQALARPNVTVVDYVDQWRVLREADVFITHQGLNSTHEAIFSGVPMISYPFFSDQPGLSERCRGLGLAIPLTAEPRGPVTPEDVRAALGELAGRRALVRERLREACAWELEVIAGRASVLDRICALTGAP